MKKLEDVKQYLISGCCLICTRYKGNKGKCNGKISSKGCLGFNER